MVDDTASEPPSDNVIDLDAISGEVVPDGPRRPRIKRMGMTLGEWSELKKREPSTLTEAQRAAVAHADATFKESMQRLAPAIERAKSIHLGEGVQNALKAVSQFRVEDLMPRMYEPTLPDLSSIAIAPSATSVEQRKQTLLLERLVDTFEAQGAERDADIRKLIRPAYDADKHILIFGNALIDIPVGTDQEILCKRLFRSGKPVKHAVEKGDMYEKLGILGQNPEAMRKKLYSAKDALNDRIARQTSVNDLFVMVDKKLWFNEKYL